MKEKAIKLLFIFFGFLSIIFLGAIALTLLYQSLPFFKEVSFGHFFNGRFWYPTSDPPEFGLLPLLLASLQVTLGALALGVPIGLGSALFLSEFSPYWLSEILKPAIEILSGIPSVVFGLFGMTVVAPFVQQLFKLPTGLTAFSASVVLGIMIIPTIVSISEDAISSVPANYKEASLAVGANKWETAMKVTLPAASSGIATSILLGTGRAIGETMTVLMVAGGAAVIPKSFFVPVRPITATIASEMGEVPFGGLHFSALFALAVVLFGFTFLLNLAAEYFTRKYKHTQ